MADFCRQCAIEHGFDCLNDLSKELSDTCADALELDEGFPALCEGCGFTLVDFLGQCIDSNCLKKHSLPEDDIVRTKQVARLILKLEAAAFERGYALAGQQQQTGKGNHTR